VEPLEEGGSEEVSKGKNKLKNRQGETSGGRKEGRKEDEMVAAIEKGRGRGTPR
jgi:hypothetical protein